jgi:hypothetical protein
MGRKRKDRTLEVDKTIKPLEGKSGKTYISTVIPHNNLLSEGMTSRIEELDQEKALERKPKGFKKQKDVPSNQLVVNYTEDSAFISEGIAKHFGFESCGFRDGIQRWDFPSAIGDKFKRHKVYRQYFYRVNGKQVMVDAFNAKTPLSEINRIKSHLESLGFVYTYVIGGEPFDAEVVFGERLKPIDVKSKDYVAPRVPKNLEEAKFAGHTGTQVI